MAARKSQRRPQCTGCHRNSERTARGWRTIRLAANGECRACRESRAEAAADVKQARKALAETRRGEKFETFMLMLLMALQRSGYTVAKATYYNGDGEASTAAAADRAHLQLRTRTKCTLSTNGDNLILFQPAVLAAGGKRLYAGTRYAAMVAALRAAERQ